MFGLILIKYHRHAGTMPIFSGWKHLRFLTSLTLNIPKLIKEIAGFNLHLVFSFFHINYNRQHFNRMYKNCIFLVAAEYNTMGADVRKRKNTANEITFYKKIKNVYTNLSCGPSIENNTKFVIQKHIDSPNPVIYYYQT